MNVTELLTEVQDLVESCDEKDDVIMRHADRMLRSLARKQIEVDAGYYNAEFMLRPDDFTEVYTGEFEARLATWVSRISEVWRTTAARDVPVAPYEAYAPFARSHMIKPIRKADITAGWEFTGTDTIRFRGFSQEALKVRLRVAKRPARLARFTLEEPSRLANVIYLPMEPSAGAFEIENGAYMGSRFQVSALPTGLPGAPPRVVFGEVRLGVASDPNFITESGVRRTRVTLSSPFSAALEAGDTIDMVCELPDEHSRLLVLMIGEAIFQKRNNTDALRSIGDAMAREWNTFLAHILPRQDQTPSMARRSLQRAALTQNDEPDRLGRNWLS
jgi:hypothetical protein